MGLNDLVNPLIADFIIKDFVKCNVMRQKGYFIACKGRSILLDQNSFQFSK